MTTVRSRRLEQLRNNVYDAETRQKRRLKKLDAQVRRTPVHGPRGGGGAAFDVLPLLMPFTCRLCCYLMVVHTLQCPSARRCVRGDVCMIVCVWGGGGV